MESPSVLADRSDRAVQRLVDLVRPSRGTPRTVLLEDVEPIVQALASGVRVVEAYVLEGLAVPDELARAVADVDVPLRALSREMAAVVFTHDKQPKVFAVAEVPPPVSLDALTGRPGDVVLLDGVRIAGNVGAIVRTAYALGASGVVLVDSELTTIADRRLIRASRSYVFALPVVLATRDEAAEWLRGAGRRVASLDLDGTLGLDDLRAVDEPMVLVFGAERTGASDALSELADDTVTIPMVPGAESLNVSVSVGIALGARDAVRRTHRG